MRGISESLKLLLLLLLLLFVISCMDGINEVKRKELNVLKYHKLHDSYRSEYFQEYKNIYNSIYDSIDLWRDERLYEITYYFPRLDYQIDSSLVFNSDSTRFYTTFNKKGTFNHGKMDYIAGFYGAKINNNWYFYFGGNYMVFREVYQDSIYAPLTFEELSYVSHKSPMRGLLRRGKNGEIEVNEEKLNYKFFGVYPTWSREQIDSSIIARNKRMHQKKLDPKEIASIQKKMDASVQPPEPRSSWRPRDRTFLEWLFRVEVKQTPDVKIFESEAWKNRKKK